MERVGGRADGFVDIAFYLIAGKRTAWNFVLPSPNRHCHGVAAGPDAANTFHILASWSLLPRGGQETLSA